MRTPLPALVLGYLLVSVGYVFGTIMLIVVLVACLFDCRLSRDVGALKRVLVSGVLLGLVAVTVYLPGVLTAPVTARDERFGGFGGKFATDPLALLASVLPTAAVPGTASHLLPYAYLAWFLPAAVWLDWGRARREWRPLGGLLLFTAVTLVVVDGPAQLGPLRWPLRLQPFLVVALVVLLVVAWHRFGLRPTRRRLVLSLAWVVVAGLLALVRSPSMWVAHLVGGRAGGRAPGAGLVARGPGPARLGRTDGRRPDAGGPRAAARVLPDPALAPAQRPHRPGGLPGGPGRTPWETCSGRLRPTPSSRTIRRRLDELLIGSGWYLNDHPIQNTYTAISYRVYKQRYCVYYEGDTCPQLLDTLFTTEPTTGRQRVDLLGVSSLLLIREDFPAIATGAPAAAAGRSPTARRTRCCGRGVRRCRAPAEWSGPRRAPRCRRSTPATTARRSASTRSRRRGARSCSACSTGRATRTDVGSLADPVDGYLVTVDLPASAHGETVHVDFRPPGWPAEIAAWVIALVGGAGWSLFFAVRRRARRDQAPQPART